MIGGTEVGSSRWPRVAPAAWLALVLLSVVWAWWAWQEGAFFGVVLLPGAIVLCAGAALLLSSAPPRGLSLPVVVATGALGALGCWSILSALWSPAGDIAIIDGQRIIVYALSFALGVGLCNLLGPRRHLSLMPLAAAGAFAGVITVVTLAGGDNPRELLEDDGTLDFPLGYRNAEAAFFAIAFFPAIGLAADRELDWRLRAPALATATLCLELFLLAQSRASMPAMLVGLLLYVLLSPQRMRALSWFALALLPAVAILPSLTSLYSASGDGLAGVADEMNRTGAVAGVTVIAALILGAAAARFERSLPGLGSDSSKSNRRVAVALVAIVIAAAAGFVTAVGDPVDWIGERAEEFSSTGSPDLSERSTRFTFNAGSERYDLWRVAAEEFKKEPLIGGGAGGFTYSYTRDRDIEGLYVHDAHSVEMELLAELGAVGLALLAIAIAAAIIAIVRARRLGPSVANLSAIALASGGYWLVHASVDWFWAYPALTAPVLALVGSAGAPANGASGWRPNRLLRALLITGLAVLAISAIPPWLSERYVNNAYATWRTDLDRAYEDIDRAGQLNPLNDVPLLAEASIARAAGDRERALAALDEAVERRPEEWAGHYLLAQLQGQSDPAAAREEIEMALALNPLSAEVRGLAERLGLDPGPAPGDDS